MQTDEQIKWEALYREEGPRLWRALLLFTGHRELANDAMAEAFAQGLARGDAIRSPGAWVWKAAFMIARGDLARFREQAPPSDAQANPSWESEELLDVLGAMKSLPATQRGSVVLHHYAGYSLAETAKILGTSRSAVGVHLFRGRARLRRELGGDDDD